MNKKMLNMFPEIRIFGDQPDGSHEEYECYVSPSVPRVGDHIQFQYWACEVYRVEWDIIDGRPYVDVFCDMFEDE